MERMVLMLDSNAGGVGKSTIARELAYLLALRKRKTLLIDLDSSVSQSVFNGKERVSPENSIVKVFREDFGGKWPVFKLHDSDYLDACFGSMSLEGMMSELHGRTRKEYVLADRLEDNHPGHDVMEA